MHYCTAGPHRIVACKFYPGSGASGLYVGLAIPGGIRKLPYSPWPYVDQPLYFCLRGCEVSPHIHASRNASKARMYRIDLSFLLRYVIYTYIRIVAIYSYLYIAIYMYSYICTVYIYYICSALASCYQNIKFMPHHHLQTLRPTMVSLDRFCTHVILVRVHHVVCGSNEHTNLRCLRFHSHMSWCLAVSHGRP